MDREEPDRRDPVLPFRVEVAMIDYENTWDQRLQIQTSGRDDSNADEYRYPYEPTPYRVLERLADSALIRKEDVVLDYGCGKGRVDFFLSYEIKAKTIGIEYDERIYRDAIENQRNAVSQAKSEFVLARAESYEVPPEVNGCYFFNPFSVEILHKVMARILESYYVQSCTGCWGNAEDKTEPLALRSLYSGGRAGPAHDE